MYRLQFLIIWGLFFLRPHPSFVTPFLSTYLADIIIIVVILTSIPFIKKNIFYEHRELLFISITVIIAMLLITSINFFCNSNLEVWIDYVKILYLMIVFWYMYFLLSNIKNHSQLINKYFDMTFYIIFLVCIVQLIDPPFFGIIVKSLYGTVKLRNIWSGYPRVYGTFYNANWFGVYLVFVLSWVNSKFIIKEICFTKYIIKAALLALLFIISGSRTAIIGAIIVIFMQLFNIRKLYNMVIFLLSLNLVFFLANFIIIRHLTLLNKTIGRYALLLEILSEGPLMEKLDPGRWASWVATYRRFLDAPLFGSGNTGGIIPHNSYLHFLNMFGLIGVMVAFIVIMFLILTKHKSCGDSNYDEARWIERGFIPAFLAMCMTAEFLFTTQVMFLLIILNAIKILSNTAENLSMEVFQ